MSIRVVTYNMRLGIQQGVPAIAEALRSQNADIIAVQEVGCDWTMGPPGDVTAELAELLQMTGHVHAAGIVEGSAHYGHALLTRAAMSTTTITALPQDIDEPRVLLTTELGLEEGHVTILSTHLSHIADRPPQGDVLLRHVRQARHPTLVMGDLNAEDGEPFIRRLLEICRDADPDGTPTFPAHDPQRRIDYLLARDGALTDVVIGSDSAASDHRYVAATWDPFG